MFEGFPPNETAVKLSSEQIKDKMKEAIKAGDINSAIETFLQFQPVFPTAGREGRSFNYGGEYAKEIMRLALKAEDPIVSLETFLKLRSYFPTENGGREFDYAGEYTKDASL